MSPQLTAEQLEERRDFIGGSDWAAVLNLPPFGCARRLWYEKRGQIADYEDPETYHQRRGKDLEAIALERYRQLTGRRVVAVHRTLRDRFRPWVGGHADGEVQGEARGRGTVELKVPNPFEARRVRREGLGEGYVAQLQGTMLAHATTWGSFGVFDVDKWELFYFDVERDDGMQLALLQMGERFWKHVQEGPAPERLADPADRRCATCVFRRTCRGEELQALAGPVAGDVVYDESLAPEVAAVLEADEIARQAEELKETTRLRLKAKMEQTDVLEVPGARVYYRQVVSNRIDTTALKAKRPEVAAEFTKPSVSRPMRLYPL